jgi:phospholipase C
LLLVFLFAAVAIGAAGIGRVNAGQLLPPSQKMSGVAQTAEHGSAVAGPANKIRHVIVFYQENHSFDETLGAFCERHHERCDGYTGPVKLRNGTTVDMKKSSDIVPSVFHNMQAQVSAIDRGKMDGWYRVGRCNAAWHYGCLTYYTPAQIPSLAALASKYVVSDRTFSMADSPSWGGHLFVAAATLDNFTGELPTPAPGFARGPGWGCNSKLQASWVSPTTGKLSEQPSCIPARPGTLDPKKFPHNGAMRGTPVKWVPTIFDRLDAGRLSWKLYSNVTSWGVCPSFAECEYGPQHKNLVQPREILSDAQRGTLPSFSVLLPEGPGHGTDQHNGGSMRAGDNWIGAVLSALQRSPEWSETAVFLTYDDCGCFYDHVPPGRNPDGTQQGPRVPMVIISPYAKVAYTDHHPATFASILRFTEETLRLAPLGANDRHAYDYAGAFNFAAPPSRPRTQLIPHAIPTASLRYLAAHPADPDNDPT